MYQNGTKYNYSFVISKDASSKTYKVTYKLTLNEEEKSCTSYVLFDKTKSHLKIDTTSYYLADDLSISKIEVLKGGRSKASKLRSKQSFKIKE